MLHRLALVALTVMLLALSASSTRANHCEGGCEGPAPTIGATVERVPLDGVLVFPISGWDTEVAFKHFRVAVQDAEGAPVEGAIEQPKGFAVAIWRPTAPWIAGARHTVTTELDVAALVEELYEGTNGDGCRVTERVQEIEVDAQPLPAAQAPPFVVEATHVLDERRDLNSLVCCDQAFPRMVEVQGHCYDPPQLKVYEGTCASLRASAWLAVQYKVDAAALPAAVRGNLATRLISPGRVVTKEGPLDARTTLREPMCLRFEILDLARGELFVDERCHGDALADQLGELELDPSAELAAACAGEPYVCETFTWGWDETRCQAWPEAKVVEEAESGPGAIGVGCDCRTGGYPGFAALLTLVLGLSVRRTRRDG